jgi:hypothetical protein
VKRYASTLSDAMEAQISAEDREIEFYTLLEEDPALENNREEAENLLEQVGDDYERPNRPTPKPGTWPTRTRTS